MWFRRIVFISGCLAAGVSGAQFWSWAVEPFPVIVHHRYVLTPKVQPDNDAMVGLSVYRMKNCPITVRRRLQYPDGSYTPTVELKDRDFGPIGPDEYTMRVPIAANASYGRAKLWSEACSRCNWLQSLSRFLEQCIPATQDTFEIAEKTAYILNPEGFDPSREVMAPAK